MAEEAEGEEEYSGEQPSIGGLSPEAQAALFRQDYGEEPYYVYLARITKSEFGIAALDQLLPQYGKDSSGNVVIVKHSPFTVRTQRVLVVYIKNVLDKLELLQNLSDPKDKRIAELWIHKLTLELFMAVNRVDVEEKPEFHTLINNILKHSWTMRTLAIGPDRERIIEARREHRITQEYRAGMLNQPKASKQSLYDWVFGRSA